VGQTRGERGRRHYSMSKRGSCCSHRVVFKEVRHGVGELQRDTVGSRRRLINFFAQGRPGTLNVASYCRALILRVDVAVDFVQII
jgi:hypothetical protein